MEGSKMGWLCTEGVLLIDVPADAAAAAAAAIEVTAVPVESPVTGSYCSAESVDVTLAVDSSEKLALDEWG